MSNSLKAKLAIRLKHLERQHSEWGQSTELVYTIQELHQQVATLLRQLGLDEAIWSETEFRLRTIRYYRSEGIVSPPEGQTSNARYGWSHVLEVAAARLAGHVGRWSLREAGQHMEEMDLEQLRDFVVELAAQQLQEHQQTHPRPDMAGNRSTDVNHIVGIEDNASSPARGAWEARREEPAGDVPLQASPGTSFMAQSAQASGRMSESSDKAPAPEQSIHSLSADQDIAETSLSLDLPGGGKLNLPTDHPLVQNRERRQLTRNEVGRLLEQLSEYSTSEDDM